MLFMHIPLDEFVHLYNEHEFHGNAWEYIACQAGNSGLFTAIKEQPTVQWVACGHDHNNDYFGEYEGVMLSYGRKSGIGCYGPSKHPLFQHFGVPYDSKFEAPPYTYLTTAYNKFEEFMCPVHQEH